MSMADYELYDREEPALSGVERDLYDAVSADEPWALVDRFADLERVSGSEDERRAAEYLADRLDALGVDHERHDPELYLSIPEDAGLRATAPVEASFDAVKTVAFSASGTVSGEVVYVEGDDPESIDDVIGAGLGDLDRDVDGKVVLMEGLLPIAAISELEARGAAGYVGIHEHPDEPHEGIATPVWGAQPEPGDEDRVPGLPIANVSRAVGDRLVGLADGDDSLHLELSTEVTTGFFDCPVVVAEVEGGADPDDDDFVLLHAHYDSWHVGVADNATGDAAILELARVFAERSDEFRRNLKVAWWPGHSTGRYAGSTWFADEYAIDLAERCVAQVNADSPGATDATEFEDMVVWMPEADGLCRDAVDAVAGKDARENRPPRAGDYSFDNLGISGLFMLSSNVPEEVRDARGYHAVGGCGGNSNAWHLTTDTLDKADPDVLVRDVRVYAVALARLLADEVLPLDFRHTVERHREYLADYDGAAGDSFDLGPVRDELDWLDGELREFYGAVESGETAPAAANEAIKALQRRLVKASFASEGRFEQDPATPRPPYPALEPATGLPDLAGEERRFAETHLRRARNEVVWELRRARAAVPTGGSGDS